MTDELPADSRRPPRQLLSRNLSKDRAARGVPLRRAGLRRFPGGRGASGRIVTCYSVTPVAHAGMRKLRVVMSAVLLATKNSWNPEAAACLRFCDL